MYYELRNNKGLVLFNNLTMLQDLNKQYDKSNLKSANNTTNIMVCSKIVES